MVQCHHSMPSLQPAQCTSGSCVRMIDMVQCSLHCGGVRASYKQRGNIELAICVQITESVCMSYVARDVLLLYIGDCFMDR